MISNDLPVIVKDGESGLGKRKREIDGNGINKKAKLEFLKITDLTADIFFEILKYLNPRDLRNFEATCTLFRNGKAIQIVIENEIEVQKEVDFSEKAWEQLRIRHHFNFDWNDAQGAKKPHRANFLISQIFQIYISRQPQTQTPITNLFSLRMKNTQKYVGLSKQFPFLAQYIKEDNTSYTDSNNSLVSKAHDLAFLMKGELLIYLVGGVKIKPNDRAYLFNVVEEALKVNMTFAAVISMKLNIFSLVDKENIAIQAALKGDFSAIKDFISKYNENDAQDLISRLQKREQLIKDVNFWYELGLLFEEKGFNNSAKTIFLEVLKESRSVPLLFSMAKIYINNREFGKANELLEEIYRTTEGRLSGFVYYSMASVKKELNFHSEADKLIQKALVIVGDSANEEFFLLASEIKAHLSEKERANQYLEKMSKAPKTKLTEINRWSRMGAVHLLLKQWNEANEYYEKIAKEDERSQSPSFWWQFAFIKSELDLFQKADLYFTKAVAEYQSAIPAPNQPQAKFFGVPEQLLFLAASVKMKLNECDEAEKYLKSCLENARSKEIPSMLFDALYKQQKWREAFSMLFEFVRKNENNKEMDFNPLLERLLKGCQWLGNLPWKDLENLFDKINSVDPYKMLLKAFVYLRTANPTEADRLFTEILPKVNGEVPAWVLVCAARAKADLNQIDQARSLYDQAKTSALKDCHLFDLPYEIAVLERKLGGAYQNHAITADMIKKLPFYTLYSMAKDELASGNPYNATQLFLGILEQGFFDSETPSDEFYLKTAEAVYLTDEQKLYRLMLDEDEVDSIDEKPPIMPRIGNKGVYLHHIQFIHFYVALNLLIKKRGINHDVITLANKFEVLEESKSESYDVEAFLNVYDLDSININSSNLNLWFNYFSYFLQTKIELWEAMDFELFKKIQIKCEAFKDEFYRSNVALLLLLIYSYDQDFKAAQELYKKVAVHYPNNYYIEFFNLWSCYNSDDNAAISTSLEKLASLSKNYPDLYKNDHLKLNDQNKKLEQELENDAKKYSKLPMDRDKLRHYMELGWFYARRSIGQDDESSEVCDRENAFFAIASDFMRVKICE